MMSAARAARTPATSARAAAHPIIHRSSDRWPLSVALDMPALVHSLT